MPLGSAFHATLNMGGGGAGAAPPPACGWNTPVITQVLNTSDAAVLIPATNYSLTSDGRIINATPLVYPKTNISYTYKYGGGACTATNSMITNFTQYPTLIGLVGTIIFLALVIGVLVTAFVFGKQGM
jgi:hypothetical protein